MVSSGKESPILHWLYPDCVSPWHTSGPVIFQLPRVALVANPSCSKFSLVSVPTVVFPISAMAIQYYCSGHKPWGGSHSPLFFPSHPNPSKSCWFYLQNTTRSQAPFTLDYDNGLQRSSCFWCLVCSPHNGQIMSLLCSSPSYGFYPWCKSPNPCNGYKVLWDLISVICQGSSTSFSFTPFHTWASELFLKQGGVYPCHRAFAHAVPLSHSSFR